MQEKSYNGFSYDFIEKLKYNSDIVDTISRYVTLQKKGKTYWGCCPFHHEKTPSFAVNQSGQFYHCFGCGESGDVIKFVQKIEGVDFMDAIKELARNANMELPKFSNGDEAFVEKKKHRDLLINICTEAAKFYYKKLNDSCGYNAREYLTKRGVDKSTITKMGLGYSPDWTSLIKHLKSLGYNEKQMLEAGVVNQKDNGEFYDAMATRLVFPVFNHNSKVCGFSGRALRDGAFAKYKNTTGTEIFNKSSILYGINLLRKARLETNYALLVEGQMDVISCHQNGFNNAIATLGTAFNNTHVQTLQRFVDNVIVCFDGDNAGRKAAIRSLEPLMQGNFNIKVVTIPENKDPDDYIKTYGKNEFQNLIDNAQNVYEFEIKSLASNFDLKDQKQLSKFIDEALEIVVRIPNFTERELYLKLISEITLVNLEFLNRQLSLKQKNIAKSIKKAEVTEKENDTNELIKNEKKEEDKLYSAQEFILASIVHKKNYITNVEESIFTNHNLRKFYYFLKENNFPIASKVYDHYNIEENEWLGKLLYYNFDFINKPEEHYLGCIRQIELNNLLNQQKILTEKLNNATNDEKIKLLRELQELTVKIQQKRVED